ncbi:class E sortase [Microbispora tritici]|uniref:Class E sortase n=2 Tax=Microbispora TaxID=2005 RepID=A0ABY3M242_9ACTN|nr:class E sortase [Microbispora fusca]TYB63529.1 class E sortase [Microbispora tritici]
MTATVRVIGELCLPAGLVLLLFYAYLLWGTGAETEREQRVLQRRLGEVFLRHERRTGPAAVRPGDALALLRIPRLGAGYRFAVVEGVGPDELRRGPGHYPGTALPGQVGNFVLSGHRTTYAAPFNRIDRLQRGDDIMVDAWDARYTYQVTRKEVVDPGEVDVVDPVPGHPGQRPTTAYMTMTTCHPKFSATQRLVVQSVLVRREERRD